MRTLQPVQSPLFMAMQDPVLHRFISYLADKKREQEMNPDEPIRIELERNFIGHVRESFRKKILDGERHLHVLSQLLASHFLGEFELHSNVIGVLPDADRPFLLRERIDRETLLSKLDLDLGNHLLSHFRYMKDGEWQPLELSANFVEYIPLVETASGVNRVTSRVKAEEELWNKVTDELFQLDEVVFRDKHLRQYSKYIKDIFGIKLVCLDEATCLKVHAQLEALTDKLVDLSITDVLDGGRTVSDGSELLQFVETKNYLTCEPEKMKKTGWRALKTVVLWRDRMFEIQVQPLNNYYLELDHMSGPSHRSFKLKRDTLRDEISKHVPLYGFYRDLLRMLFSDSEVCFGYPNASVHIT